MSLHYQVKFNKIGFHLDNSDELIEHAVIYLFRSPRPVYTVHDVETGKIAELILVKLNEDKKADGINYMLTDQPNHLEEPMARVEFFIKNPPHTYNTLIVKNDNVDISWNITKMATLRCAVGESWDSHIRTTSDAIRFLNEKILECLSAINAAGKEDPAACLEGAQVAAELIHTLSYYPNTKVILENRPTGVL